MAVILLFLVPQDVKPTRILEMLFRDGMAVDMR